MKNYKLLFAAFFTFSSIVNAEMALKPNQQKNEVQVAIPQGFVHKDVKLFKKELKHLCKSVIDEEALEILNALKAVINTNDTTLKRLQEFKQKSSKEESKALVFAAIGSGMLALSLGFAMPILYSDKFDSYTLIGIFGVLVSSVPCIYALSILEKMSRKDAALQQLHNFQNQFNAIIDAKIEKIRHKKEEISCQMTATVSL